MRERGTHKASQTSISTKSSILSLNPFLGKDKLIRVGGRLSNAQLPLHAKHPIILTAHPLVALIIRQTHLQAMHAGTQLTISTLRQNLDRARSNSCQGRHPSVYCLYPRKRCDILITHEESTGGSRFSSHARVSTLRVGLRRAGPIQIRSMSGCRLASCKLYIAIFVCLATRAVYLEVVDGYSTPAFLGIFSRFCARHGLPESVYSDNGTTFVGADRELTAALRASVKDPHFLNNAATKSISWHFIPSCALHFGGL